MSLKLFKNVGTKMFFVFMAASFFYNFASAQSAIIFNLTPMADGSSGITISLQYDCGTYPRARILSTQPTQGYVYTGAAKSGTIEDSFTSSTYETLSSYTLQCGTMVQGQQLGCQYVQNNNNFFQKVLSYFASEANAAPCNEEGGPLQFQAQTSTSKSIITKKVPKLSEALVKLKTYQRGNWSQNDQPCTPAAYGYYCYYDNAQWEFVNERTVLSTSMWLQGAYTSKSSNTGGIPNITHKRQWCDDGYTIGYGNVSNSSADRQKQINLTQLNSENWEMTPTYTDCQNKALSISSKVLSIINRAGATLTTQKVTEDNSSYGVRLNFTCPTYTNRYIIKGAQGSNPEFYLYDSANTGTFNDSSSFMNGARADTIYKTSASTTYSYTVSCYGYSELISSASANVTVGPSTQATPTGTVSITEVSKDNSKAIIKIVWACTNSTKLKVNKRDPADWTTGEITSTMNGSATTTLPRENKRFYYDLYCNNMTTKVAEAFYDSTSAPAPNPTGNVSVTEVSKDNNAAYLSLSWTCNNATKYEVYRRDGGWTTGNTNGTGGSISSSVPRNNTTYYYDLYCNTSKVSTASYTSTPYVSTNKPPVPLMQANPTSALVGQIVNFNTGGSDPDGDQVDCTMDFQGDGVVDDAVHCSRAWQYAYNAPGSYNVRFTMTDNKSTPVAKVVTITVTNPPQNEDEETGTATSTVEVGECPASQTYNPTTGTCGGGEPCPAGTTYNPDSGECDGPAPCEVVNPDTLETEDCPPVSVTANSSSFNSPVGQNVTISWETDGETCSVRDSQNNVTFGTGITTKSFTFNATNPNHSFLNSSHLANNAPSNALGFNITCSAPDKNNGTALALVQVYTPTLATIDGPDSDGDLNFTCKNDHDTMYATRDGLGIDEVNSTYNGYNQQTSISRSIRNAPTGVYTLTCKNEAIDENIDEDTKNYGSLALTGTIEGNTGGSPTNATTDSRRFSLLQYSVSGADSVSVVQEIRNTQGDVTDTLTGSQVNSKYRLTAPDDSVDLNESESPIVDGGITWMITARKGSQTKVLNLSIENDNSGVDGAELVSYNITPIDRDTVSVSVTCKKSYTYAIYNMSMSPQKLVVGGNIPSSEYDLFTNSATYDLETTDPAAKYVEFKFMCQNKEVTASTPFRVDPKLISFRVYPEQILCSYGSKVTVNYTVESPSNCRVEAAAIQDTTCKPTDSADVCNRKTEAKNSISEINEKLRDSTTNSDNNTTAETRSYTSSLLDVKYSTKFKLVCDKPSINTVLRERSVEATCQGEN